MRCVRGLRSRTGRGVRRLIVATGNRSRKKQEEGKNSRCRKIHRAPRESGTSMLWPQAKREQRDQCKIEGAHARIISDARSAPAGKLLFVLDEAPVAQLGVGLAQLFRSV